MFLERGKRHRIILTSKDVVHSFWVPEFRLKQDAVPGKVTSIVITPTKVGTYRVICTELCGLGHALMRTSAIVMTQEAFDACMKDPQMAAEAKRFGIDIDPLSGPFANAGESSLRHFRAAIETLAIVAYHQPVTRAEIEEIRGVIVSTGTIDILLEEGWLKPRGHYLAVNYFIPDRDGPPFGVDREEIWTRFSPHFELVEEWTPRSYPNRTGLERMFLWRRR